MLLELVKQMPYAAAFHYQRLVEDETLAAAATKPPPHAPLTDKSRYIQDKVGVVTGTVEGRDGWGHQVGNNSISLQWHTQATGAARRLRTAALLVVYGADCRWGREEQLNRLSFAQWIHYVGHDGKACTGFHEYTSAAAVASFACLSAFSRWWRCAACSRRPAFL
jgi:hypothetical protein